eukprot:5851-Heterococcus_DN1.PRE.3
MHADRCAVVASHCLGSVGMPAASSRSSTSYRTATVYDKQAALTAVPYAVPIALKDYTLMLLQGHLCFHCCCYFAARATHAVVVGGAQRCNARCKQLQYKVLRAHCTTPTSDISMHSLAWLLTKISHQYQDEYHSVVNVYMHMNVSPDSVTRKASIPFVILDIIWHIL